jgi:maleylpyruvate isomerase
MPVLHGYFRSSAAYRVRIALNLKGITYDQAFVHLLRDGGEQHKAAFRALNPLGLVPAYVDGGAALTQSLAIIEYLDEVHPEPPLLPAHPLAQARVRAFAQSIACDIHPVNNLRILKYLESELGVDKHARDRWVRHWIAAGFDALEAIAGGNRGAGPYAFGEHPTQADLCLVPQVFNARRFGCDMASWPTLEAIDAACAGHPAFAAAHPSRQPDAE